LVGKSLSPFAAFKFSLYCHYRDFANGAVILAGVKAQAAVEVFREIADL